jgi:DNA mismatch repair protein MutH
VPPKVTPPQSEQELLVRAQSLAGRTLGTVANSTQIPVPPDLKRAKGWVGELIERTLGATAGSTAQPDFVELGIELKTIPIRRGGQPSESTHVCVVPQLNNTGLTWKTSWVCQKLSRVLWVPIESDRDVSLQDRRIGAPLLWSPTPQQDAELAADWEELMELVVLGELDQISAHRGQHLQIRPKAANAKARAPGRNAQGQRTETLPLGFYLRPSFTAAILAENFHISSNN